MTERTPIWGQNNGFDKAGDTFVNQASFPGAVLVSMFGLLLAIPPTLLGALLVCLYGLRPKRLADLPLIWMLVFWCWFLGMPVLTGWIIGLITWEGSVAMGFVLLLLGLGIRWLNPRAASPKPLQTVWQRVRGLRTSEWVALGAPVLLSAGLFFLGSLLPLRTYDAIGYHAHNPVGWALNNSFELKNFGVSEEHPYGAVYNTYGNMKAIWPFIIMDYSGGMTGTATSQSPYLLLLFAALLCIWRRFGFSLHWCGVSWLFCTCAPEILLQSLELYADLAYLAASTALVACLLILWQEKEGGFKEFLPSALGFVLVSGLKPSGLLLSVGLGIAFLVILIFKNTEGVWAGLWKSTQGFILVVFLCLVTSGYWPVQALLTYGNPVYPYALNLGGVELPGGVGAVSPNLHSAVNLGNSGISAWWQVVSEQVRTTDLGHWHNGLGAAFFVMGLPAVVVGLVLFRRHDWRQYGLLLGLFLILGLCNPAPTVARFLLYQLVIASFFLCWVLRECPVKLRNLLLIVLMGLLGLNLIRTAPAFLHRGKPAWVSAYALLSGDTRWLQRPHLPGDYTPLDFWRDSAGEGDRLALWRSSPIPAIPEGLRGDVFVFARKFEDFEAWKTFLKQEQITHVYLENTAEQQQLWEWSFEENSTLTPLLHRRSGTVMASHGFMVPVESALLEVGEAP
jgi:hypothetical protein